MFTTDYPLLKVSFSLSAVGHWLPNLVYLSITAVDRGTKLNHRDIFASLRNLPTWYSRR